MPKALRHLNGGAKGADVVESGDGVFPSSQEAGVCREGGYIPPSQKNLDIFSFEMVHFDAFWSIQWTA